MYINIYIYIYIYIFAHPNAKGPPPRGSDQNRWRAAGGLRCAAPHPGNPKYSPAGKHPRKPSRSHPRGHGQDFGRRASEEDEVPVPRPTQTPTGHASSQGPRLVTPTPRSGARAHSGRVGQAPTFRRVSKSWPGRVSTRIPYAGIQ